MLDKKVFLKGLKYIYDYYTKFDFDISNTEKVGVWYQVFEGFDDTMFSNLVKSYCVSNQYAPQSPTSIINFYKDTMSLGELTADEAWQIGYNAVKEDGFRLKHTIDRLNTKYPQISRTLEEIKYKFIDLKTDDVKFVSYKFIEVYNKNLKQHLDNKMSDLQIGFTQNKLLEGDK